MSTLNKVLIAALVAQVALAFLLHASTDATETIRRPEPLLSGFDAGAVTRVAIYAAREPDQGEGDREPDIELDRESAGDSTTWKLSSHYGYPVTPGKVDELLQKLAGLRTSGPAVTSKVRHGQLEVAGDQYRRKIVVESPAGTTALFIGKPSRARQTFVRLEGEDAVHAVNGITDTGVNVNVTGWVSTSYFQVPSKKVAYMSVRNQNGFYEFQRNEHDHWSLVSGGAPYPIPEGKKFNAVAADNWVKDAVRLVMTEPADPAREIATPLATITLRIKPEAAPEDEDAAEAPAEGAGEQPATGSGEAPAAEGAGEQPATATGEPAMSEAPEEHVIVVGAKEDDEYYVRLRGAPNAIMVRESRLRPLVEMNDDVVLIAAED